MAGAGESARREYERRRLRDRETRRRNFPRSLILVALTPFAVYWAVQAGAWALNEWLLSSMFGQYGVTGRREVIDASTADIFGKLLAVAATFRMAIDAWGARPTTESWRKGAEGEVKTGNALGRLPGNYVVLHDLRMPGSSANIDHLVIGPTGVFTVETKNYTSDVIVRRGVARHAGRPMDGVVEQANRQAEAVRSVLGCAVRAIVCLQGGQVRLDGWFAKPIVDGVRLCSGRRLVEVITRQDREVSPEEVSRLATAAEQRLGRTRPAPSGSQGERCGCGGTMVLRHRRADGAPFWGCSRYPSCRRVLPA